jgi:hypothetical protein
LVFFYWLWKDDNSKAGAINATDKIINAIIQILVLLKGHFCFKEKIKEEGEGEKIKKAKEILKEIETQRTTISELSIFVENNKNTQNEEKKQEIESIKKLLMNIRKEEEIIIEILNKYKILII